MDNIPRGKIFTKIHFKEERSMNKSVLKYILNVIIIFIVLMITTSLKIDKLYIGLITFIATFLVWQLNSFIVKKIFEKYGGAKNE
jgi:positive regulator of sigma E activity